MSIVMLTAILLAALALAQEADNTTTYEPGNESTYLPDNSTESQQTEQTAENSTTETAEENTTTEADTTEQEPVAIPISYVESFDVVNVTPDKSLKGDVILSIDVQNTGNTEIKNLLPVVVAKGFSTYDTVPIKKLLPGETKTAMVSGTFDTAGEILLNIKIQDEIFHDRITITQPKAAANATDDSAEKAREKAKQDALRTISAELDQLKTDFTALEQQLSDMSSDYYTSDVDLTDLRKLLMNAQSSLLAGEPDKANISTILAQNEYKDQLDTLSRAKKRPFISKVKDNALLISAIAGALIASFTLWEVLKKKKEGLYQKIKEVKINKDTKIVVQKRKPRRKKKPEEEEKEKLTEEEEAAAELVEAEEADTSEEPQKQHHDHGES
ncbi:hypothetical protein KY363_00235 [Candidatus Woesearchaeota archaeon]|nr:hypothetical protein [Candidatus Woesearchaeota archaeon]